MITVVRTPEFDGWLRNLRDRRAAARIAERLLRAEGGNLGDHKIFEGGLGELRIDHGPGYRVYILRRGPVLIVLLCGGEKPSQRRDIRRARDLARNFE
jgi:putative addiction module killer protein